MHFLFLALLINLSNHLILKSVRIPLLISHSANISFCILFHLNLFDLDLKACLSGTKWIYLIVIGLHGWVVLICLAISDEFNRILFWGAKLWILQCLESECLLVEIIYSSVGVGLDSYYDWLLLWCGLLWYTSWSLSETGNSWFPECASWWSGGAALVRWCNWLLVEDLWFRFSYGLANWYRQFLCALHCHKGLSIVKWLGCKGRNLLFIIS